MNKLEILKDDIKRAIYNCFYSKIAELKYKPTRRSTFIISQILDMREDIFSVIDNIEVKFNEISLKLLKKLIDETIFSYECHRRFCSCNRIGDHLNDVELLNIRNEIFEIIEKFSDRLIRKTYLGGGDHNV